MVDLREVHEGLEKLASSILNREKYDSVLVRFDSGRCHIQCFLVEELMAPADFNLKSEVPHLREELAHYKAKSKELVTALIDRPPAGTTTTFKGEVVGFQVSDHATQLFTEAGYIDNCGNLTVKGLEACHKQIAEDKEEALQMDFAEAVRHLLSSLHARVRRKSWPSYMFVQQANRITSTRHGFLSSTDEPTQFTDWAPTQDDIRSMDWRLMEDGPVR